MRQICPHFESFRSRNTRFAGNDLPTSIWDAAVVQYKDSFLLVGGHDPSVGPTRDVYQYDTANDDWIKLETQLKYQRSDHVAFLVEKTKFPQCT